MKNNHVFRDQNGSFMTPDHIREAIWKPLQKAELPYRPPDTNEAYFGHTDD
jgi:hypothetical protein